MLLLGGGDGKGGWVNFGGVDGDRGLFGAFGCEGNGAYAVAKGQEDEWCGGGRLLRRLG